MVFQEISVMAHRWRDNKLFIDPLNLIVSGLRLIISWVRKEKSSLLRM